MTSRPHAHKRALIAAGHKRVEVMLSPDEVRALEVIKARAEGLMSDAAAVRAAVILAAEAES